MSKRHNSAWTGRASRSMTEAFGPYTNRNLHPMPQPTKTGEGWFVLACLVCAVLGILATYWRT